MIRNRLARLEKRVAEMVANCPGCLRIGALGWRRARRCRWTRRRRANAAAAFTNGRSSRS